MSRRTSTTLGVAAAVLAAALFGLTWRNMSTHDASALETRGRAVTTTVAPAGGADLLHHRARS